jgi:dimethylaniline monooxygenase (N-oxide forming)
LLRVSYVCLNFIKASHLLPTYFSLLPLLLIDIFKFRLQHILFVVKLKYLLFPLHQDIELTRFKPQSNPIMASHVAVIGAGPLGLMALKNMKEDGFDVTGFETRPYVGGLWKYSEDSALSVAESTIFNSSKYRSAISDFPFPPDTDDFPTWQQMHQYLESYCDHFDLRRHILLNSPVTDLSREGNRWVLEISPKGQPTRKEYFDKVVVASGSFVKPKTPKFPGIEKFQGPTTHSLNFHQPSQYKGKTVLIIGLHATTQDVAVALSGHASKLYVSHRNGLVMVSILRV